MARAAIGLIALLSLSSVSAAAAQAPARLDPDALQNAQQALQRAQSLNLDASRLQLEGAQAETQQFSGPAGYEARADNGPWVGWVNFNRSGEPALADEGLVTRIFESRAGGVRFGFGAPGEPRLMFCQAAANACGSGAPSGGHVLRNPDGSLRIDFARPVTAVTMQISPDRRSRQRAESFQIEGWGNGDIMLQARAQMPLDSEIGAAAPTSWTTLTLNGQAQTRTDTATAAPTTASATEFDYVIIRGFDANGVAVDAPFLIDDLRFLDQRGPTPLDSLGVRAGGLGLMLEDTRRLRGALLRQAQTIREGGRREGSLYPTARRVRLAIDYDAAEVGARRQRTYTNTQVSIPTALGRRERVSVPILAPLGVFNRENPRSALADQVGFMGRRDFFHLIFPTALGEAVISGTRLASPSEFGERNAGTLTIGSGYDGASASFSLYGAAYSVRLVCEGVTTVAEDRSEDPPCNDPAELEALLDRLFLFLPPQEDQ